MFYLQCLCESSWTLKDGLITSFAIIAGIFMIILFWELGSLMTHIIKKQKLSLNENVEVDGEDAGTTDNG